MYARCYGELENAKFHFNELSPKVRKGIAYIDYKQAEQKCPQHKDIGRLMRQAADYPFEWVRAGHDPAPLYDPGSDAFSELGGSGIALGVDDEWIYSDSKKADFSNGQILFLSTDGIWEARIKKGEMLGKEPILNAIRQNASSDATQIIDTIFDILDEFTGEVKIEDDITSVVIKMQN